MYKKGNRLAWTGFILAIVFAVLEYLGDSSQGNAAFVPSLQPFVGVFALAHLACIALIIWGTVLALRAKNRSLWWLLLVVPALAGGGIIFVAILFMLKNKPVTVPSNPPASNPANNTPASS